MLQFAEIQPFVQDGLQTAANKVATLQQLQEMLTNNQTRLFLQIELAAVVDAGKPMVESTYILEGDGTLAWQCYEQLLIIQNSIHGANLPNLTALSRQISQRESSFGPAVVSVLCRRNTAWMGVFHSDGDGYHGSPG